MLLQKEFKQNYGLHQCTVGEGSSKEQNMGQKNTAEQWNKHSFHNILVV